MEVKVKVKEAGAGATPIWTREEVDGKTAIRWLSTIKVERRLVQMNVEKYARAMLEGEWVSAAGDPIRFSDTGALIDGQHRLWAVVESDTVQRFNVIRGVPAAAMAVMDTGKPRSLTDILQIRGEINAHVLSGLLRLCMAWDATEVLDPTAARGRSTQEALRYLDTHREIEVSVSPGRGLAGRLRGGASRWAAVHAILSRIPNAEEDRDVFLSRLETGDQLASTEPIGQLRRRLLDDVHAPKGMNAREYTALIFKAWNLWREGRTVVYLGWRGGGAHPEVYPSPI